MTNAELDFRLQLLRANIKTMLNAKTVADVDLVYDWIVKGIKEIRDIRVRSLEKESE